MTETAKQNLSILVITLLLAASLYIFFDYLRPAIAQEKNLELKIKETQKKIELLQEYKAKAAALVRDYNQLGEQVDKINLALPTDAETAQVLASLSAISRNNNIALKNLSFQKGKKGNLSYLDVKTSFTTSYDNYKKWLEDIEKEIRITDVQKVSMKLASLPKISSRSRRRRSRSRITSFPLDISITLRCYYEPITAVEKEEETNH